MTEQETRASIFQRVQEENWDLIIVGGGITGAGIMREAVRRNLKTLLVEQRDFAWGTSSRSSKMVHGGLRYLKEGDITLMRESVQERVNLIQELPGLVMNRIFIMPFYRENFLQRLVLRTGFVIYDLLARKWRKKTFSQKEMRAKAPAIDQSGLKGGFILHEAVTDDARLVYRVLSEAMQQGGTALNYCRVDRLVKKEGRVSGIVVTDTEANQTVEVSAGLVINATGAWADKLRQEVRKSNAEKIRPLRGSHVVLSSQDLPLVENISLLHPRDRRPVSVLNWEGRVLMGTTDIDHAGDLNTEPAISPGEVDYLLEAINHQFPGLKIDRENLISAQAGVRPVVNSGKENPSKESRDHVVWSEEGLLTVTGGKLTTFRIIALDALKAAQEMIGPLPDLERRQPIFAPCNPPETPAGLSDEQWTRLLGRYGRLAVDLVNNAGKGELESVSVAKTLWAELRWAAGNEQVARLEDLMLRRTRLGMVLEEGGKAFLPRIREICQSLLGWSDARWLEEERNYLDLWQRFYKIPSA